MHFLSSHFIWFCSYQKHKITWHFKEIQIHDKDYCRVSLTHIRKCNFSRKTKNHKNCKKTRILKKIRKNFRKATQNLDTSINFCRWSNSCPQRLFRSGQNSTQLQLRFWFSNRPFYGHSINSNLSHGWNQSFEVVCQRNWHQWFCKKSNSK